MQIPVKVVVEVISGTVVPAAAMFINFAKPSETFLYFIEGKTAKRTSLKPLSISDENAGVFDSNAVKPGTILAAGSYLENVRLPASFSIEVIK
jgi:hypothetical protein